MKSTMARPSGKADGYLSPEAAARAATQAFLGGPDRRLWQDRMEKAAARILSGWRNDPADQRESRVRTDARLVLAGWRKRAALERDHLWLASCWAQSAIEALTSVGLDAAEQDLALAAAILEDGVPKVRT